MKKAAIFTWYNDDRNCGQTLQAFALQKAIEKEDNSIDATIITYRNDVRKKIYRNRILYPIRKWLRMNRRMRIRQKKFDLFIADYMKVSKPLYKKKQILNYLRKTKVTSLIVGSDQVWNPQRKLDDVYFLNFGNGFYKASYASSMMSPALELQYREDLERAGTYLNDFDYISVREKSAVNILKNYCNKKVVNVLDPVFLLDKSEWAGIEKNPNIPQKRYILVYCLGEIGECIKIVDRIYRESGLPVIYIDLDNKIDIPANWNKVYNTGPAEFIWLIHHAEYVCCDSFHGTAFSIIFKKNFFTVPSIRTFLSNMYRVTDLLDILGLNERYIETDIFPQMEIDYKEVNANLEKEIEKSRKYLRYILEINE